MTTSGLAVAHRITVLAASLLALGAVVLFATVSPSGEPDGRLLVADLRGRALIVVDLAQAAEPLRIALPGGPHELLELPDGRIVASLEQSGALAVVDLASGAVERIETGGLPHGRLGIDVGPDVVGNTNLAHVLFLGRFLGGSDGLGWWSATPGWSSPGSSPGRGLFQFPEG